MSTGLDKFKENATAPKKKGFSDLLAELQPQFKAALPAHLKENAERYMRMAVTEYRRNPQLQKCDPYSVLGAAMVATQLGLEVGPGGRAFLIPYGNECTFVPGWKGLVELATRSGRASIWSGILYEGQPYEYEQGDQPRLKILEESDETDPEKIAHAYAIGRVKGAEYPVIEKWSRAKIVKHRDRYNKIGQKHYSFSAFEMYARKVPLLQVLKYMPYSPELEAAIILDAAAEQGRGMSVQSAADAIDGVFTVDPAPGDGPKTGAPSKEELFAMCDEHVKAKRYDEAKDLLPHLNDADRKIIEDRLRLAGQ